MAQAHCAQWKCKYVCVHTCARTVFVVCERAITRQVQACSHKPVDSSDTNIMMSTSTCLGATKQERTNFTFQLLIR